MLLKVGLLLIASLKNQKDNVLKIDEIQQVMLPEWRFKRINQTMK